MPENPKLDGYLGFSIRSGQIVLGADALERWRKPVYLLLLCESAGKNTAKFAHDESEKRQVPLYTVDNLAKRLHKTNCKFCALTDPNLAKAAENALKTFG